jgi:hypothetical protein
MAGKKAGKNDRKKITALRRRQAEVLVHHMARLSERVVATTYPIYQASDRGTPDALASALLIELGGARFVVTATHVMRHERVRELRIATPSELLPIRGERVVVHREGENDSATDDIDITAVRVSSSEWDALPSSAFVQWSDIDHARQKASRDSFTLTGYPVSKQRGGLKGTSLSAYAYQAMAKEGRMEAYEAERRDPKSTLVVGFDRRRLWGPDGLSTAPDMYGMSGSGIWRIGPNAWEATSPPKLSAVVTEWRAKGRHPHILGTRIRPIIVALSAHHPDVMEFVTRKLSSPE